VVPRIDEDGGAAAPTGQRDETDRAQPGWVKRHLPKLVVSVVIGAGFVWVLNRGGLPLIPPPAAFAATRWWAVAGYLFTIGLAMFFRTYRWTYLLEPIAVMRPRFVLGVGLIGFAAILLAPLRMGEVVRPYMISQHRRVSFIQAMGTVGAERVIDGLVLSLMLLAGLLLSTPRNPLPDHLGDLPVPVASVPVAAYGALAVFTCAFTAMGLFYWRRELARKLTHAVVGIVSDKLALWFTEKVEKLADGLRFLASAEHGGAFLRDTLLYWSFNAAGAWLLLWGSGVPATLAEACVTMGVLGVGILVPAGPGFFGAFQFSVYCALAMFFPEGVVLGAGSAFVFLLYTTQVLMTLVSALIGFWLIRSGPEPLVTADASASSSAR
jgi:glycosyltransferase 2 family protein